MWPARAGWPLSPWGLALVSALLLAGCGREAVVVYEAPKDAPPPPPPPRAQAESPHGSMSPHGIDMTAQPSLTWKSLPEGWTSTGAAGLRVANFDLQGADGATANLAVIPLPGTGGTDLDLVNLWRAQLSLPEITESQLPAHTDNTTAGGQAVRLFTIVRASTPEDASAAANQILVAALRRDGFTWFFKLAGDATTVESHRQPLKSFLEGVEFQKPTERPRAMAAAVPPPGGLPPGHVHGAVSGSPTWTVPPGWEEAPLTPMIQSKWVVSDSNSGSPTEITVSVFPGETGGLVANLNRWRSQVGLSPAPDAELLALENNLDVLGGKATLADFTGSSPEDGTEKRMIAAVVRRGPQTWFYKILGPAPTVEAQRETFVRFVQSVQYPPGA